MNYSALGRTGTSLCVPLDLYYTCIVTSKSLATATNAYLSLSPVRVVCIPNQMAQSMGDLKA